MDIDGYPEECELQKIREWDTDFKGLMGYIRERWKYAHSGFWKEELAGDVYHLSTAGWSGNESIIEALRENILFYSMCWQRSERGGHYIFRVKH